MEDQQEELKKYKEELNKRKEVGENANKTFKEGKRLTAGVLFKAGVVRLGKTVLDFQKDAAAKKKQREHDAKLKAYKQIKKY